MKLRSKYAAVILGVAGAAFIGLSSASDTADVFDLYPASQPAAVSGDIGHLGAPYAGELYPASQPAAAGMTRQEVQGELEDATMSGSIRVITDPSALR